MMTIVWFLVALAICVPACFLYIAGMSFWFGNYEKIPMKPFLIACVIFVILLTWWAGP